MVGLIFLFQGILFQRFLTMPPGNRITLKAATMPSPSNLASSPLTDTTIWTRDGLRIHTHAPLLAAIRSGAILRHYTRWFSTGPLHFPYRKEKYLPSQQEAVGKEALVGCNLFFYFGTENWEKPLKNTPYVSSQRVYDY